MAFSDFTYPDVEQELGLTVRETDLFQKVPAVELRVSFRDDFQFSVSVGSSINTEKARSEFLIAPVLLEVCRLSGERVGVFSGVPLEGDSERGLNGTCDFILTNSGRQTALYSPIVAVVEAKNDNIFSGLGQCIAAMVAAQLVNTREGKTNRVVYGVTTTGMVWRFLRLQGTELTLDRREYSIDVVDKLIGVLQLMVRD